MPGLGSFGGLFKLMVITVVTPSYNQSSFLAETIESILGQEGNFTIDYVIVDGASTDGSVEIIQRYETLLERGEWPVRCRGISYRWLSEKDRGQADAIMKGFALAQGEIVAWLNSDDTYLPGSLAKVENAFGQGASVGVVYGMSRYTDEHGKGIGSYPTEPFDFDKLAVTNFICQPSTFFTRTALTECGGIDTSLHFAMDYDLWIRLAARNTFYYLPAFLSTYRLHGESKTMSPRVALANHRETLETVRRHYAWAPLNRVYIFCHCTAAGKRSGQFSAEQLQKQRQVKRNRRSIIIKHGPGYRKTGSGKVKKSGL